MVFTASSPVSESTRYAAFALSSLASRLRKRMRNSTIAAVQPAYKVKVSKVTPARRGEKRLARIVQDSESSNRVGRIEKSSWKRRERKPLTARPNATVR